MSLVGSIPIHSRFGASSDRVAMDGHSGKGPVARSPAERAARGEPGRGGAPAVSRFDPERPSTLDRRRPLDTVPTRLGE